MFSVTSSEMLSVCCVLGLIKNSLCCYYSASIGGVFTLVPNDSVWIVLLRYNCRNSKAGNQWHVSIVSRESCPKKSKHVCKWMFTLLWMFFNIPGVMEVICTSILCSKLWNIPYYIIGSKFFGHYIISNAITSYEIWIKIVVFWIMIPCSLLSWLPLFRRN
jgi:hypothetical protein